MLTKKHIIRHIVCVLFLCCMQLLFLHVLPNWNGLHGTAELLFPIGCAVIFLSFCFRGKAVPIITSLAYPVSLGIAAVLQQDGFDPGGGRINNMWGIWLLAFLLLIGASLVTDAILSVRNK